MAANEKLAAQRAKIDAIDDKILALLEQRARVARAVGEEKRRQRAAVYHVAQREAQILRRLRAQSDLLKPHITAIYREIISACLACEKPLTAAYFGPAGTYTHEAALKTFGHAAQLLPAATIGATLTAAEKDECDVAIVPFENSAAGTVGATMDALVQTPLVITGETVMRIRHNLLSADARLQPAAIRHLHAHPQALHQCRRWIENNAPRAVQHAADSNAAAAKTAAEAKAPGVAAIGSAAAGEIYRLKRIAANIEDYANNSTRFLVFGRQAPAPSGRDKTSLIMTVKDEPGAMFTTLKPFADHNVNMVKLESRPLPDRLWEYLFFIDCIGHRDEQPVAQVLAQVKKRASFMKVLGSYPQAVS